MLGIVAATKSYLFGSQTFFSWLNKLQCAPRPNCLWCGLNWFVKPPANRKQKHNLQCQVRGAEHKVLWCRGATQRGALQLHCRLSAADSAWGPRRRCSAMKLTKVKQRVQILQQNTYRLNDSLRLDAAHKPSPLRLDSFFLNVAVNDTLLLSGEAQSLLFLLPLLQCHVLMHSHAARGSAAAPSVLIHHPVWPAVFISANCLWFFSRYYRQSLHQHTIWPLSSLCRC